MIQRKRCLSTAAAVLVALTMVSGFLAVTPARAAEPVPDAWIKGHVDDGMDPLPNSYVKVMMFSADGIDIGHSFTDESGDYEIPVAAGLNYAVFVANQSFYMEFEPVSILPGMTKWVNFSLTPISDDTDVLIKGFVRDSDGLPVLEGHVLGIVNDPTGADMPFYANLTTVEVNGYFEVNVIPGAMGGGTVAMDIPGYGMIENTSDDPLESGQAYWFNITVEPPTYADDSIIFGFVTEVETGDPLEGVLVTVETENRWMEGDRYNNYTYTDASGYYEINVVNGSMEEWGYASVMMMKGGYTMALFRLDVDSGEEVQQDAELSPVNCVIRGNVTDAKTDLPILFARVIITDGLSMASMAITNSTGGYELYFVDGEGFYMEAQLEMYSRDSAMVDLLPGDEIWMDFEIFPASGWLEGTVTDIMTGDPIENADVSAESDDYEAETRTDENGEYSLMLVPGTYDVFVNAWDYIESETSVDVLDEATTVLDVELYPWSLPEDCRLFGRVIDSDSTVGIQGADVTVVLEEAHYRQTTKTNSDGEYEMYVPRLELEYGVTAYMHYPEYDLVDTTGEDNHQLDVALAPDVDGPEITYTQDPYENITWFNPSIIDIEVQELNLRDMMLLQLRYLEREDMLVSYYAVSINYTSLDPFDPQKSLDYGNPAEGVYTIDEEWDGSCVAGWLENQTDSLYLPAYLHSESGLLYYAVSGRYSDLEEVYDHAAVIFDGVTGERVIIHVGDENFISADDPFGVFEPSIYVWTFGTMTPEGYTDAWQSLPGMNVTELHFTEDWTVPTGSYRTVFRATDFGHLRDTVMTELSVDNDPPVADAGEDIPAVINTMVTLNGSGSYDVEDPDGEIERYIVSYEWDFEDDGVPVHREGMYVDYEFTILGSYAVNLTVTDCPGHQDTDMMWVVVGPDNPPIANAGPDFSVNEDATAQFSGAGSYDDVEIVNYTWTFTDQSVEKERWGETPTYVFSMPGTYVVTLVVNDTIDQTDSDTVTVTVNDITPPVAVAVADPDDPLLGELVTLDGSDSSDNSGIIVSYVWTFSDGGVAVSLSGESVDYTFSEPGEYVITLTVTDSGDNTDTDIITVTVTDNEDPVADAGPDQTGVVAGTEVTLDGSNSTDNSGTIESYTWTFTDENAVELSGVSPSYVFDNVGTYNITLTVEDPSGNSDTDEVVVTVVAPNSAPVADAGADQTVSVGETVTLSAIGSTDSDGMIVNYTWTFMHDGELVTLTGMEVEFEFEVADTYEVTLTVTDDEGASDTDTVIIIVEGKMSQFLQNYWWLLAVLAAAVVFGVVFMLMRPGKGGRMPSEDVPESEPESEEEPSAPEELPPPPDDL